MQCCIIHFSPHKNTKHFFFRNRIQFLQIPRTSRGKICRLICKAQNMVCSGIQIDFRGFPCDVSSHNMYLSGTKNRKSANAFSLNAFLKVLIKSKFPNITTACSRRVHSKAISQRRP